MSASARQPGLLNLLYRAAWRCKRVTHFFLPAKTRQRIQDWLFRKTVARPSGRNTPRSFEPFGINIAGYLRAELGVGEAARATLRAATAAGIPLALVERQEGSQSRRQEEIPSSIPRQPAYAFNVLHFNPDQLPYAFAELGADFFAGRYNIGYWNWELPEFPKAWMDSLKYLDEIWVPSAFCESAIRARTSLPVTRIPYCIDLQVPAGAGRKDFGLPEKDFCFLFVFDALSVPERKNPLGLLEAYRRARPACTCSTRLVLKIINADAQTEMMQRIRAAAAADPSITILDRYLDRPALNALFNLCDAYVSLHRSEGFGLTMAEAMALGKPVIATDWSANTDFMKPGNSLPVRYRLVQLAENHGPYARGQTWADADLDHAAAGMAQVANDVEFRNTIGRAAREYMASHLSPPVTGALIRQRLEALYAARS